MNCFLDMDGVLVDFFGPFVKKFGGSLQEALKKNELPISVRLEDHIKVPEGYNVYDHWTAEDWLKLEPYPWAKDLIARVEHYFGPENVYLCTSAGYAGTKFYEEACAGKSRWVAKYLPDYTKRLIICFSKKALAHPDAVLIDDQTSNFVGFLTGRGKAILFPAYWNDAYDVLDGDKSASNILAYMEQKLRAAKGYDCCP